MARSGLSLGLSTFNSCNKAGSIPHFTNHLKSNPGDYTALMWRGRAFSIINDQQNAIRDFGSAAAVSSGPRKCVAQYFEASSRQDANKSVKILGDALRMYPNSHEVVAEVGCLLHMSKNYAMALPVLEKAITLMTSAGPVTDPIYCWVKHDIGIIHLEQNNLDAAEKAFAGALHFSETHTVSHIGYARVKLAKGDEQQARRHYDRARVLNPTLVHWTTFDSFKAAVQPPETWYDKLKNLPWTMANKILGASTQSIGSAAAVGTTSSQVRTVPQASRVSANQSQWQGSSASSQPATTAGRSSSATVRAAGTTNRSSSSVSRTSGPTTRPSSATVARSSSIRTTRPQSAVVTGSTGSVVRPVSATHKSKEPIKRVSKTANLSTKASSSTGSSVHPVYRPTTVEYHPKNETSSSEVSTRRKRTSFANVNSVSNALKGSSDSKDQASKETKTVFSKLSGITWHKTPNGWVELDVEASRKSTKATNSQKSGVSNSYHDATKRGRGNGRGGGNGGDGGGSGSDDEDDPSNEKWRKMRKESREILKYDGKEYVLSKSEKHYYSRDKAGHGTAYLKVYANKKNRLDFIGSLDRNMKFKENKHESREGTSIRKSDMDVVRRR